MRRVVLMTVIGYLYIAGAAAAEEPAAIRFPNSGSPQAQADFREGVKLLHCFQYRKAEKAFQAAWEKDPGFAMAAWGEALCHVHPIWNEEDLGAGRASLARLEDALPGVSERERGFVRAARVLFGEGEREARYAAYAKAMQGVSAANPEDPEAAAFHGLAVLGTAMGVRDRRIYDRAGAIMEPHFEQHPAHPGLAHYIVHCYDDPENAKRGLAAARALAKAAPDSSHALHMPSHIFLALGLWPEVVSSNEASWRASGGSNHHALYWLQYGHLQLGRTDDAATALQQMATRTTSTDKSRLYLASMRAAQLVDGGCPDSARSVAVSLDGLSVEFFAATHQANGYCAWKAGDAGAVRSARDALRAAVAQAPAPETPMGKQQALDARLALGSLNALVEDVSGRRAEAISILEGVLAKEEATPAEFGPPTPPKPVAELLGELLVAAGRPGEAIDAYRAALALHPRRSAALHGLARAADAAGDDRARAEAARLLDAQ